MVASNADKHIIRTTIERGIESGILLNKTIIIFGCTFYARDIRDALSERDIRVSAFVDNNEEKTGKNCLGLNIYLPQEFLVPHKENIIVIVCSKYNCEMQKQLEALGYTETSILEIPVSESQNFSDSLEQMDHDFAQVEEGYFLYRKIIEKYSGNHRIFVCPYPGTGDVYMACAFLPEYLRKENIADYLLIVSGNSCTRTAELFGTKNVETLSWAEIQKILKAWEFLGNARMNLKPLLYWGWRVKRYLYADRYPQITFTEMFRYDVFNLDASGKMAVPVRKEDNGYVEKLFEKLNLKRGKTIIIAPYAGSFVSDISMETWGELAERLKEKGYCVCTNCFGEKEVPIHGTRAIIFPYDEARNVLEYAGGFIAVRSGLCDIVSSARCKMVIIYENGFNASRYEYFSLRRMGLNDFAEEIVMDKDITKKIESIF